MDREKEFTEATFHVYHETPACPAIGLAFAVKDYTNEVTVYPRDSCVNGWREILARLPCVDLSSIKEPLKKYHDVVTGPTIVYSNGEEDISFLYARVSDEPLNFLMGNTIKAFIKLKDYRATIDHEEFIINVFPPSSLDTIVTGLKEHTTDFVLARKKSRPLKEMTYSTPLLPPEFERVLDEEEEEILRTAFQKGWFDYPRPRSGRIQELAKELGIAPSTVDVRLRSVSRRLSQAYFRQHLYGR